MQYLKLCELCSHNTNFVRYHLLSFTPSILFQNRYKIISVQWLYDLRTTDHDQEVATQRTPA